MEGVIEIEGTALGAGTALGGRCGEEGVAMAVDHGGLYFIKFFGSLLLPTACGVESSAPSPRITLG